MKHESRPTDGDLAQVSVIGVDDALPGDGGRIDIQSRELLHLFFAQRVAVSRCNAQFRQTLTGGNVV